jgi:pyruvate dehydrogenase E2 component (dihydrolipoamide acetyltransferase)
MIWKVGMPNLGHTMDEGKVAEWLFSEGDAVRQGDIIATVDTDKATFDIEAPGDGVLAAIHVAAGDVATVGATIATITTSGETAAEYPNPLPSPFSAAPTLTLAETGSHRPTRVRASPAARALAEDLGVDLAQLTGTGEDGLISRDDVKAATFAGPPQMPAVLLSPMRRVIATATLASWRAAPHVALTAPADLTRFEARGKSSLTAAVVRAVARALPAHPTLNGWLRDGEFQRAANADVGLALSTIDGLVTATIPKAETKPEGVIAAEIAAMAAAAQAGRLDGARMTGASFTVSSLGRWGVQTFAPIIAAPQVAILGVGRVDRVAREIPGGFRFVSEVGLTLVFDHRANDGVAAAQLLADIITHLETPEPMEPAP